MEDFCRRNLRCDELSAARSAESDESFPSVYEPIGCGTISPDALGLLLDKHKKQIRADVTKGGVLLRNCGVRCPEEFEMVIRRLGYSLMEDYIPADVRRTLVAGQTFTAADAPLHHFIPPHHEQSYSTTRPGVICFFAHRAPAPGTGGETPIFNTRGALSQMSHADLEAIRTPLTHSRMYTSAHTVPTRKWRFTVWLFDVLVKYLSLPLPNLRHHPPWQQVFHTEDRAKAEAYAATMPAMTLSWTLQGDAAYSCVVPNIVKHPVTGDERITFASAALSGSNMRECCRIADGLVQRSHLPFSCRALIAKLVQWVLLWSSYTYCSRLADGKPNPLGERPFMSYWEQAVLFPWRNNDVLILDNVNAMHARMPCSDHKRRILTGIADPYTTA